MGKYTTESAHGQVFIYRTIPNGKVVVSVQQAKNKLNQQAKKIQELEAQLSISQVDLKAALVRERKLEARLERARPYLRHLSNCDVETNPSAWNATRRSVLLHALQEDCTCGLTKALEEISDVKTI